jgi:hypothetical protein
MPLTQLVDHKKIFLLSIVRLLEFLIRFVRAIRAALKTAAKWLVVQDFFGLQ